MGASIVLAVIDLALYSAVATLLTRAYRRNHVPSSLYLLVPLVVVPCAGLVLAFAGASAVDTLFQGINGAAYRIGPVAAQPGTWVAWLYLSVHILWGVASLVAVTVLDREWGGTSA